MVTKNKVVTKEDLVKIIANAENTSLAVTRSIYNTLEKSVRNILASVEPNCPVLIKLFEGISIEGEYVGETVKKNNLTGKETVVSARIKPRVNITRSFKEKINNR